MKKILYILIFLSSLLIYSCKNDNSSKNNTDEQYDIDSIEAVKEELVEVFYSLPSPMEMASLLKRNGVEFNEEYLNPTENTKNYLTNRSMALNLGIYGADLSYASLFEQNQITIEYLAAIKKLATDLHIMEAINDSIVQLLEENITNNKEVRKLIAETFFESDRFLKENDKEETAAIVVVGAWIESLYIAVRCVDNKIEDNEQIVDRIIDQRLTIGTVLDLLDMYKDNKEVQELITDLERVNDLFIKMVKIEEIEAYDAIADTTRTKTIVSNVVTKENFKELSDMVTELRDNYTK